MKCDRCLREAPETSWRPPKGYNPDLRQYHCAICNRDLYEDNKNASLRVQPEDIVVHKGAPQRTIYINVPLSMLEPGSRLFLALADHNKETS